MGLGWIGDAWAAAKELSTPLRTSALNAFESLEPVWDAAGDFLSNPWARAVGMGLIVYLTIRIIASVYSGDKQNSEIGPLALRPHMGRRLSRKAVMLPHSLMPMTMDGVSAHCRVFYVYRDAQGKRRRKEVYHQKDMRLAISPSNLRSVAGARYGYEVPDVATEDVCFPPVDLDPASSSQPATPDRALEYAALHKIIENWTEDDNAPLISFEENVLEEIVDNRRAFITDGAGKVRQWRESNPFSKWLQGNVAKRRPNVVGSYYVKLEFSHNPLFVLTRHPDRELKMTAWLTVLTSAFALIMDAWPTKPNQLAPNTGQAPEISRTVRPPSIPQ